MARKKTIAGRHQAPALDDAVAFLIYRVSRRLRRSLIRFLGQSGLEITPEQWFLIHRLSEQNGRSPAELADQELNDRPNITRLIDQLEKRGLVTRAPNPRDRRSQLIYLTDAGSTLFQDFWPQIVAERRRIFRGISDSDVDRLVSLLRRVEENL